MSDDARFANRPGKADVLRILAPWVTATCCHNCAETEARVDCLLATLFEQSRENAALAGDLVYFRSVAGTMPQTIDRLQREIARKDAELARMRTNPANRTSAEKLVSAYEAMYHPEYD